jgi:hypothetical protein
MNDAIQLFNNRELSSFFWLSVAGVFMLSKSSTRADLYNVLRSLLSPPLLIILGGMLAYSGLVLLALNPIGQLDLFATKVVVAWTIGVGAVLLFNFQDAKKPEFIKQTIIKSLQWTVLLEFLVNLYSFSLFIELLLIPLVTFLGMTMTYASFQPEHKKVERLLSYVLAVITFVVLAFSLAELASNPSSIGIFRSLRDLTLPLILTIGFLPYVYMVALYATYENISNRLRHSTHDEGIRRFAWRVIILHFHANLHRLSSWSQGRFLRFRSKEEVLKSISSGSSESGPKKIRLEG